LHGRGSSAQATRLLGFNQKADREGFFVAYLEATGNPRLWNSNLERGAPAVDDLGYVRTVLDRIMQAANIDARRVYLVGHSSGGMMAYRAAVELSPRIAAVGVVGASVGAGTEGVVTRLPIAGRPVSVMHIHGRNDRTIPFAGGRSATLTGAEYLSARESVDFWVKGNRCQTAPRATTIGTLSREAYTGCDAGTSVEFLTLLSGGHEWPRAVRINAGTSPSGVDLLWTFFAAQAKP
jgi:polyhydroxybutyrate depolymerase